MFRNGYFKTGLKALDNVYFREAFRVFLNREMEYRAQFLQKYFPKSIDGYSFMGQKDSLNQYDFDQLHSFVLSKFNDASCFPVEFQELIKLHWDSVLSVVTKIEKGILSKLNNDLLYSIYPEHIGHMVSANYYPPSSHISKSRLSAHKDVSLLTVFPFGIDGDLKVQVNGSWQSVDAKNEIVVLPGYLMEKVTKGDIPAIEHKVDSSSKSREERFSFAFFSIPKPEHSFNLNDHMISAEKYMQEYLELF